MMAGPVNAESGGVVLRLTLRGPIDPTDTFTLGVTPRNNPLVVDIGIICGPEAPGEHWSECTPRSYDFPVKLSIGTVFDYTFARVRATSGEPSRPEVLYRATVSVAAYLQTRTVVFDYGLGASTLPDTARSAVVPAPLGPLGAVLLVAGMVSGAVRLQRLAGIGLRH